MIIHFCTEDTRNNFSVGLSLQPTIQKLCVEASGAMPSTHLMPYSRLLSAHSQSDEADWNTTTEAALCICNWDQFFKKKIIILLQCPFKCVLLKEYSECVSEKSPMIWFRGEHPKILVVDKKRRTPQSENIVQFTSATMHWMKYYLCRLCPSSTVYSCKRRLLFIKCLFLLRVRCKNRSRLCL